MTSGDAGAPGAAPGSRSRAPLATLAALPLGLAAGAAIGRGLVPGGPLLLAVADTLGGLWIDALRMTIVPLLVALVVTSVAEAGGGVSGGGSGGIGRLTAQAVALFVALLAMAAIVCAIVIPPLFVAEHGGAAAARAVAGLQPVVATAVPPVGEWLRALVPANLFAAAAEGRIVSLVLFALLFGAAARRIEPGKRAALVGVFAAVRDAMLRIVAWVLWLAPVGVFALILSAAAGDLGGLLSIGWRYVAAQLAACGALLVALLLIVAVVRRGMAARFAAAAGEPAMLALASRSSIACLPAMIAAADRLGLDRDRAGTVLSLAVGLFKVTAAVTAMALMAAMAAFDGHPLGGRQIAVVGLLSIVNTLVIAGLPGQVSFMASTLPVAAAIGVPLTVLPLLLAIDSFADMARTVVNVVADLATAALLAPGERGEKA